VIAAAAIFAFSLVSIMLALYAMERKGVSAEEFIIVMVLAGIGSLLSLFNA
jgi:Na+/H+ antiporter NhaA